MTPEDRLFRATDAQQLLENQLFVDAFAEVANHLNMAAMSCEPDNKDKAQRIIISQQLLAAIKREIQRIVQDGKVAQVQLNEIEQRKKFTLFRR